MGGWHARTSAFSTDGRAHASRYAADYGRVHWTYSRDLLSGALVLCDPAAAASEERRASAAAQVRCLAREVGR